MWFGVSLMVGDAKHLSGQLVAVGMFAVEMSLVTDFGWFSAGWFSLVWSRVLLTRFGHQPLSDTWLQMLPPVSRAPFTLSPASLL